MNYELVKYTTLRYTASPITMVMAQWRIPTGLSGVDGAAHPCIRAFVTDTHNTELTEAPELRRGHSPLTDA